MIGITKRHDSHDVPMIGIYRIHTDNLKAVARSQADDESSAACSS